MHGRIKVRTTEEEKERKLKEQALKVKAYRAAMTKIQAKRQQKQYDDELLQLTLQVLQRNPDITTLWNIRRECIENKIKTLPNDDVDTLQLIYDKELGVAEQCLIVSPKCYGAWQHRRWTLEHCPQPNWDNEVHLCTKYLKLDERNFHTWDYRRYVIEKADVSKESELDFCTEKIKANFSNYSSWHHRSLLLPQLYPYVGDELPKRPMSEPKLKEELEMVLTAAFTDPNDSSAWFYQRWLLGYSRPDLAVCSFRIDKQKAIIGFTKSISKTDINVIFYEKDNQIYEISDWHTNNGSNKDAIWTAMIPKDNSIDFETGKQSLAIVVNISNTIKRLELNFKSNSFYYLEPPNRTTDYSKAVLDELNSQLESCNSLLEYEPDSKWTLLTTALLMRAINHQQYHHKSLEYLQKLQKVDNLRENYYKDLASKWRMEKLLADWSSSEELPTKFNISDEIELNVISDYSQYLAIADEVSISNESNLLTLTFNNLNLKS